MGILQVFTNSFDLIGTPISKVIKENRKGIKKKKKKRTESFGPNGPVQHQPSRPLSFHSRTGPARTAARQPQDHVQRPIEPDRFIRSRVQTVPYPNLYIFLVSTPFSIPFVSMCSQLETLPFYTPATPDSPSHVFLFHSSETLYTLILFR